MMPITGLQNKTSNTIERFASLIEEMATP